MLPLNRKSYKMYLRASARPNVYAIIRVFFALFRTSAHKTITPCIRRLCWFCMGPFALCGESVFTVLYIALRLLMFSVSRPTNNNIIENAFEIGKTIRWKYGIEKKKRITIIWSFLANIQSTRCKALAVQWFVVHCHWITITNRVRAHTQKKETRWWNLLSVVLQIAYHRQSAWLPACEWERVCAHFHSNLMCPFTRAINFIRLNFGPWI